MTDTTNTPLGDEGLIIEQSDRIAANELLGGAAPNGLLEGHQDSLSLVRAFARYRLALLASRNTASVPVGMKPVAWRTEYRDVYRGHDTGWRYCYSEIEPNPTPLTKDGCGHRNVTPLYAAPAHPPVEQPSIPEGMAVWQGGDSAPEDWDQNEPVKRRSGAMNMVSPDVPTAWLHDDFPQSDIIAYTPCPKPSEQPAVRLEISEEDVEQLFWKWWHGDRPEGGGPAAGFHAGYRAALTAALGKGDRT